MITNAFIFLLIGKTFQKEFIHIVRLKRTTDYHLKHSTQHEDRVGNGPSGQGGWVKGRVRPSPQKRTRDPKERARARWRSPLLPRTLVRSPNFAEFFSG